MGQKHSMQIALRRLTSQAVVFIALVLAVGSWVLASPVGSDPDGQFHLSAIWCGSGFEIGKCEPPDLGSSNLDPKAVKVPTGVALAGTCGPGHLEVSASCQDAFINNREMYQTQYNNEGRLYPNGYYWVASKFVVPQVARTALTIRLLNVAIFITLLIALYFVCSPIIWRAVYLSVLITIMPLGLFLVASNNGSSWTIAGLSVYWAYLYSFICDERPKAYISGALALVSALLAAQARADGAVFVVMATGFVCLLALARKEVTLRKLSMRLLLPACICVAAGVSYMQTGQKRAITEGLLGPKVLERDAFDTFLQNLFRLPGYLTGIFGGGGAGGGLGWLDVQLPESVTVVMTMIIGGILVTARGNRRRSEIATLLLLLMTVLAVPMISFQLDRTYVGENVQSRYVLPLIVMAVGMYLIGSTRSLKDRFGDGGRLAIVVGLTLAQLVALHRVMRRYITGIDVLGWDLNTPREWWWHTGPLPMTVLYLGTTGMAFIATWVIFSIDGKSTSLPNKST